MPWTDEQKQKAIDDYVNAKPTPQNSTEIIKQIADEMEQSPNGVRWVLSQAGVYVKKDPSTSETKKPAGSTEGTKRVSKESSISALKAAIKAKGAAVDDEILDKLTGKAAVYLTGIISG